MFVAGGPSTLCVTPHVTYATGEMMQIRNPEMTILQEILNTIPKVLFAMFLLPIGWLVDRTIDFEFWLKKQHPRTARAIVLTSKSIAVMIIAVVLLGAPIVWDTFQVRNSFLEHWKGVVNNEKVMLTFSTNDGVAHLRVGDTRTTFHMDHGKPVIHGSISVVHPNNWWYSTTLITGHPHTNAFIGYGPFIPTSEMSKKITLVLSSIQAWQKGELIKIVKL